ncbi:YbaB/EbfC family nucleoid-associated protein [Solwaraspora sp. WMMD792]|uniref:YbaB/EbfC family nucleoid-associated protein n=1 Tax=Solwaraspora sp. WMMD792 TaxID=3016099 RepID=UPI00241778DA|nr:YbaB/EbfC family nucleoid-associated protein [Solwaraspora sp. WMMD792]MDG4772624.1 YbaB/EbfC family nucleoid-associated protein [Solwaraspora sp. WMMD792]
MERPNWNSLSDIIGDLKRATAELPDLHKKMLKVTGTAWSDDRMIKAVVGPRGHLLELDIDPRVFRKPNSKALSAAIVQTVRLAVEDATRQSAEIIDETLPSDLRSGRLADDLDITKLVRSHDADVRLKEDEDRG